MQTFLKTILEHKRDEVARLRKRRAEFAGGRSDAGRPFVQSLNIKPRLALIAEIKKASPSKGLICKDFDPAAIARTYEQAGANAVSVLTDERFFQGSIEHLKAVRENVSLPVLRKDFLIDPLQLEETAYCNADAALLIAAALSDSQMAELYEACAELKIETLVEVHAMGELERVMRLSPPAIGINNRDLDTFKVDLETTFSILPHVPPEMVVVSESGISTGRDTEKLSKAGVHAVLVGESLMRSSDPAALIAELCRR